MDSGLKEFPRSAVPENQSRFSLGWYACWCLFLLLTACGGGGSGGAGSEDPPASPTPPAAVTPINPSSISFALGLEAPEKISMPYPLSWSRGDGGSPPGVQNDLIAQYRSPLEGPDDRIYDSIFLLKLSVEAPISGGGISNFRQISSSPKVVAGQNALEVIFDADLSGLEEFDMRLMQTTFAFNEDIFAVLYLAEKEVFDRWVNVARFMVNNLRLGQIVFDQLGGGSRWGQDVGRPAIASDGENYLVVTCRENDVSGQIDLVGRLVYSDRSMGAELVVHPDIDVTTNGCENTSHSLTFTGQNYMLVYAAPGQVLAKRISVSGEVLDLSPIEVSEDYVDYGFEPAAAFDGANLLVVWNEPNVAKDVRGAFLSPDGFTTPSFTIADGLGELYPEVSRGVTPQVVYGNSQYLVLWNQYFYAEERYEPANPVYAQLLDLAGNTLLPEPLMVRSDNGTVHPRYPQAAFDGEDYLVAWIEGELDSPTNSRWAIKAKKIDSSGAIIGGGSTESGAELVASTQIASEARDLIRDHLYLSYREDSFRLLWSTAMFEPEDGVYGIAVNADLSGNSGITAIAGTDADTLRGDLARPALPNLADAAAGSLVVWASEDGTIEAWTGNFE